MQPAIGKFIGHGAVRCTAALVMLLLSAGILLVPSAGHGSALNDLQNAAGSAPNVPMPGNPTIVGFMCPFCNAYIDAPGGKIPAICPHCKRSFAQPTKPKPAQPVIPKLKGTDPFGDSLFHDVPIVPDDGKLKTRHFDQDGLAAKAEAWGKEMKQVDTQARQNQEAQAREFERNKQELLKGQSNGLAMRQLKNVYADGNAWNGDSSVVDLRNKTNLTPRPLRNGSGSGAPGSPIDGGSSEYSEIQRVLDQGKYSHMSPEELDAIVKQYPDNAEIQHTIATLKAQTKSVTVLGDMTDQTARNREVMESEYDQAGRKGREAASTILSLTTPVPDGLVSLAYGDKTVAQWAGIDVTSYALQDIGQDKLEKFLQGTSLKSPPVIGFGGLIKGAAALSDLKDMGVAANESATYLVDAKERDAELQASGGTGSAVDKWSDMRNDALNTSARLARLIQEENEKNKKAAAKE